MEQSCEGLEVTSRIACVGLPLGTAVRWIQKGRCRQSLLLHSELDRLRQGV